MAYVGPYWKNKPDTSSPINAANLEIMDEGITRAANITGPMSVYSDSGRQSFEGFGNFQHYGLNLDGSFNTSQLNRVSNNDMITFDRDIMVSVKSGFKWGYVTNNTWRGWYLSNQPRLILKGTGFFLQIAREDSQAIPSEIADVSVFLSQLSFQNAVLDYMQEINPKSPEIFSSSNMQQGIWNAGGTVTAYASRICSKYLYPVKDGDIFDCELGSGLQLLYAIFDKEDKSLLLNSGWITELNKTIKIETEGLFFIQVKKPDESNIIPSEFSGDVKLYYGLSGRFDRFKNAVEPELLINDSVTNYNVVQGTIGETGWVDSGSKRVRTVDFIPVDSYQTVIRKANNLRYGFHFYNKSKRHIGYTNWLTDDEYVIQPITDCKYIKMVMSYTNNANIVPSDVTNKILLHTTLKNRVDNLSVEQVDDAYSYLGEKMPSTNTFDAIQIIGMSYSTAEMVSQDIDVYGDFLFIAFSNTEQLKVYELSTKTLVASISVAVEHGSGIQFSNEFYDENDEFPLLYAGGWTSNEINVIRITKSGDTWSGSVVKKLVVSTDYGYYMAPSIDSVNQLLYCYGYKGTGITDPTNKMVLLKCDLTDMEVDEQGRYVPHVLSVIETPYMGVMQGRKYYKGRLYIGFAEQNSPHNARIVVVDVSNGETKNIIDMTGVTVLENEGLCFVINENKIYWLFSDVFNIFKVDF